MLYNIVQYWAVLYSISAVPFPEPSPAPFRVPFPETSPVPSLVPFPEKHPPNHPPYHSLYHSLNNPPYHSLYHSPFHKKYVDPMKYMISWNVQHQSTQTNNQIPRAYLCVRNIWALQYYLHTCVRVHIYTKRKTVSHEHVCA